MDPTTLDWGWISVIQHHLELPWMKEKESGTHIHINYRRSVYDQYILRNETGNIISVSPLSASMVNVVPGPRPEG